MHEPQWRLQCQSKRFKRHTCEWTGRGDPCPSITVPCINSWTSVRIDIPHKVSRDLRGLPLLLLLFFIYWSLFTNFPYLPVIPFDNLGYCLTIIKWNRDDAYNNISTTSLIGCCITIRRNSSQFVSRFITIPDRRMSIGRSESYHQLFSRKLQRRLLIKPVRNIRCECIKKRQGICGRWVGPLLWT